MNHGLSSSESANVESIKNQAIRMEGLSKHLSPLTKICIQTTKRSLGLKNLKTSNKTCKTADRNQID